MSLCSLTKNINVPVPHCVLLGGVTGRREGDTLHRMAGVPTPRAKLRTHLSVGRERTTQVGPGAMLSTAGRV